MKLTLLSLMGLAAFAMAEEVEVDTDGLPKKPPGGGPGPFIPGGPGGPPGGPLIPGGPGGPGGPILPPHGPPHPSKSFGGGPGKWTTSTVYSTTVKTIISCPPEKPACPATSTRVTTVIVPVSTTICPVETTTSKSKPHPHPYPPKPTGVHPHPYPPKPKPTGSDKPKPYPPHPTAAPHPAPPGPKPPVTTAKSIGTTGLPPKASPTKPSVVTAGAAHVQRAGGALAAIAVAAVLL